MKQTEKLIGLALALLFPTALVAQQESSVAIQLEFGAIITTGNTEDENIKYKVEVAWDRGAWDYIFSSDGFRSAKEDVLAAQRAYHVGRAAHTVNESSFI